MQPLARQLWLTLLVRLTCLLSQEIIEPLSMWLDLLATRIHDRQIEPRGSVTNRADFIRHVFTREARNSLVEFFVRVEIVEMTRNGIVIANIAEVARFPMLDLQWDATRTRGNDRDTCV